MRFYHLVSYLRCFWSVVARRRRHDFSPQPAHRNCASLDASLNGLRRKQLDSPLPCRIHWTPLLGESGLNAILGEFWLLLHVNLVAFRGFARPILETVECRVLCNLHSLGFPFFNKTNSP